MILHLTVQEIQRHALAQDVMEIRQVGKLLLTGIDDLQKTLIGFPIGHHPDEVFVPLPHDATDVAFVQPQCLSRLLSPSGYFAD